MDLILSLLTNQFPYLFQINTIEDLLYQLDFLKKIKPLNYQKV